MFVTNKGRGIQMIGFKKREIEDAVSPVVGVMLMLVVTIIIAAVVSGFAGGLIGGNNQKTPTLAMDVNIVNNSAGTSFTATVLSVSEPIPTKNLMLSTVWTKGTSYGGGSSTTTAPYGFGPGITGNVSMISPYNANQNFGSYTLVQGTGMIAESSAVSPLLGTGYTNLSVGDVVTVRVIYTPNGKAVFQKDVIVTGA
jgi:FlaG/FlaF family flagellin (archaellin)